MHHVAYMISVAAGMAAFYQFGLVPLLEQITLTMEAVALAR